MSRNKQNEYSKQFSIEYTNKILKEIKKTSGKTWDAIADEFDIKSKGNGISSEMLRQYVAEKKYPSAFRIKIIMELANLCGWYTPSLNKHYERLVAVEELNQYDDDFSLKKNIMIQKRYENHAKKTALENARISIMQLASWGYTMDETTSLVSTIFDELNGGHSL